MAVLCSSAYNPLAQFTKHTTEDRGSQRDRLVSRNSDLARQGFRSDRGTDSKQIANEFASYGRNYAQFPTHGLGFQQVQHEKERALITEEDGLSWGLEFNESRVDQGPSQHLSDHQSLWSHQITTPNRMILTGQAQPQLHSNTVGNGTRNQMGFGVARFAPNHMTALPTTSAVPQATMLSIEDLDWDTVFASLESAENTSRTKSPVLARANVQESASSSTLTETIISLPSTLQDSPNEPVQKPITECIKAQPPLLVTPKTAYQFQEENPFIESSNPFEEGLEILRNDGNLSFAALAFEAACLRKLDHFDAWLMLGSTNSENERETSAITALKEALKLDPSSLVVIMKLAISYTNEGTISLAHDYLEKWLRSKYPAIPIAEFGPTNYSPTYSQSLERIKDAFITAAQLSVTSSQIDPDVQVGLGVLLFSAQHFQLAADCFSSAIQTSVPGDTNTQSQLHLLWNRYGACLGNMNQHEAGIEAYEMALAIRPNFVRARYNLGLLYNNKKEPLHGAKNTLQALVACRAAESKARSDMLRVVKVGSSHGMLEEIIQRNEPTSIYETLRKCCGSMCRWDLAELVGPDMDLQAFGKELDKL